jgi:hypothetical protein
MTPLGRTSLPFAHLVLGTPRLPTGPFNEVGDGQTLPVGSDDSDGLLSESLSERLSDLPRVRQEAPAIGVISSGRAKDLDDDRPLGFDRAGLSIAPDSTSLVARRSGVLTRDRVFENFNKSIVIDPNSMAGMSDFPRNTGSDEESSGANLTEGHDRSLLHKREGRIPQMGRFWLYFESADDDGALIVETSWLPESVSAQLSGLGFTRLDNGSYRVTVTSGDVLDVIRKATRALEVLCTERW